MCGGVGVVISETVTVDLVRFTVLKTQYSPAACVVETASCARQTVQLRNSAQPSLKLFACTVSCNEVLSLTLR